MFDYENHIPTEAEQEEEAQADALCQKIGDEDNKALEAMLLNELPMFDFEENNINSDHNILNIQQVTSTTDNLIYDCYGSLVVQIIKK